MLITFEIKNIQVLNQQYGPDIISMKLDKESPYPNLGDPGYLELKTANGYGVEYCREILGFEPNEIIKI